MVLKKMKEYFQCALHISLFFLFFFQTHQSLSPAHPVQL